jgi:hypothetical protein
MRTASFLLAGLLLLAAMLIVAKLFSTQYPEATRVATWLFALVWLLVAGFNMWVGVSRAGYSVREELPIFLLLFAAPVVVAAIVKWKLL